MLSFRPLLNVMYHSNSQSSSQNFTRFNHYSFRSKSKALPLSQISVTSLDMYSTPPSGRVSRTAGTTPRTPHSVIPSAQRSFQRLLQLRQKTRSGFCAVFVLHVLDLYFFKISALKVWTKLIISSHHLVSVDDFFTHEQISTF